MSQTNLKYLGALIALVASFACGRFLAPTKVVTETKTVEVEKKVETKDTEKDKHQETTTVTEKKPDGTVTTTTKTITDAHSDQKIKDVTIDQKTTDEKKTVVYAGSPVTVSVLGGIDFGSGSLPTYGASITKPVLGPITLGVWGLQSHVYGLSIGLQF